jgi:hypothetical protein
LYGIQDGLGDNEVLGITSINDDLEILHTFSGEINLRYKGKLFSESNHPDLCKIRQPNSGGAIRVNDSTAVIYSKPGSYASLITFRGKEISALKKLNLPKSDGLMRLEVWDNAVYMNAELGNTYALCRVDFNNNMSVVKVDKDATWYSRFNKDRHIVSKTYNEYHILNAQDSVINKGKLNPNIRNIQQTRDGQFWFCSAKGVINVDEDGNGTQFLEDFIVNNVFVDDRNNIWMATQGDGLFLLTRRKTRSIQKPEPRWGQYTSIFPYGDNVLLGTDAGNIGWLDSQLNYHHIAKLEFTGRNKINQIVAVSNNRFIVGTNHSLYFIDQKPQSLEFGRSIKSIVPIEDKILAGTNAELRLYDMRDRSYKIIVNHRITSMCKGGKDVWFSTNEGVYYMSDVLSPDRKTKKIYNGYRVNHLAMDKQYVYMATNNGLWKIDKADHRISEVDPFLRNKSCNKIRIVNGDLWVGTYFGLIQLTMEPDGVYSHYTWNKLDGLLSNQVDNFVVQPHQLLTTSQKWLSIIPRYRSETTPPRMPNILSVESSNKTYDLTKDIVVPSNERELNLRFATPVYDQEVSYDFRLLPSEVSWSRTNANSVRYPKLSPGKYEFQIRTRDFRNDVSALRILKIDVPFLWYERLSVQLALLSAIVLGLVFIIRGHFIRVRKREQVRHKLDQRIASLELEAIKAQINPHFMYNCLNSIRYSVVTNQQAKAEKQLSIFANLTRKTLDFSRLNFISLQEEMDYLWQYLAMEKLRFKERLYYVLRVSENVDKNLRFPSMIIQPFLENAIKHGIKNNKDEALEISVEFSEAEDNTIVCEILDTGGGFEIEERKWNNKLHGIEMTKARAETYATLFNVDISIDIDSNYIKREKRGTRVCIFIQNEEQVQDESIYS